MKYETLERICVEKPVDRLNYIESVCRGKIVLDIGCYDETALVKVDTRHWLHGRIASVAKRVVGVDNSAKIPVDGLRTAPNAIIYREDGSAVSDHLMGEDLQVIVAGEFIEHIENPIKFLSDLGRRYPGRELIITTPNGVQFANTLLGMIGREAQHHDHIHVFTYKVLNTLCLRSEIAEWKIIPYHFSATEMILMSSGARKLLAIIAQALIRCVERLFPMLSSGYVVHISLKDAACSVSKAD